MFPQACPYCGRDVVFISPDPVPGTLTSLNYMPHQTGTSCTSLRVDSASCPNARCRKVSIWMTDHRARWLLWPKVPARDTPGPPVPPHISAAYAEAALVEADSITACAIMARRCLEMALKHLDFKGRDLEKRIEAAVADPRASYKLKEQLHRLRVTGNYGVHPDLIGELSAYEVGDNEVDAAFDALDDLFEDFFVTPDLLAARKAQFEEKDAKAKEALAAARAAPKTA